MLLLLGESSEESDEQDTRKDIHRMFEIKNTFFMLFELLIYASNLFMTTNLKNTEKFVFYS